MVRAENLDTLVSKTIGKVRAGGYIVRDWDAKPDAVCASACSFAFMGGVKRNVRSGYYGKNLIWTSGTGKIGIHQFYDSGALKDFERPIYSAKDLATTQVLVGILLEYTSRMGISADVVRIASKAGPNEIRWLSDEELIETRMDNGDNITQQQILATSNGAALLNVRYLGDLGNYHTKLQCINKDVLRLEVRLDRSQQIDQSDYASWGIYENFIVNDGKTSLPVRMLRRTVSPTSTGSTTQITLEINGRWTFLTKFSFEDRGMGSRWGNMFANDLSFALDDPQSTMKLLYRACG